MARSDTVTPPVYCDYVSTRCPEEFPTPDRSSVVLLYASRPPEIASTIQTAARVAESAAPGYSFTTWVDFAKPGHVVFCEICKHIRTADAVVADVTTLNFNLLFEIGFVIG